MKKKHMIFLSFILFLLFISVSYSSWSYGFCVTNIISTYEFSAKINVKELDIIDKKLDKEKNCELEIPLLKNKVTFNIENTGTIPIYIKKIEILYEGPNKEIIKQFNYTGFVTFRGLDFFNKKLELSIRRGDFKKEDFYIEPLDSKGNSKEAVGEKTKDKLSEELLISTDVFDKYNKEISKLNSKIASNKSKIAQGHKDSSKLERENDELNKKIDDMEREKAKILESMKNDKIKIKFYFERFNK